MLQAIAERERQEQAIAQLREALQQSSRLPASSFTCPYYQTKYYVDDGGRGS
jgi:hypothetical protein